MALWQDMKTTPRRISAGIELSSPEKGPDRILIIRGFGCPRLLLDDQRIGREFSPASLVSWYLSQMVGS